MRRPLTIVSRLALAALLTLILLALSCAGLFLTTEPRMLSLLVEPFSLLLMPGLLVALAVAGRHEFDSRVVLAASACFYFMFFYVALSLWTRHRRAGGTSR